MLTDIKQKVAQKYSCDVCDYNTSKLSNYKKHITTDKHLVNIGVNKETGKKVADNYECDECDYVTCKKSNFDKHLDTHKHSVNSKVAKVAKNVDINEKHVCSNCNKCYTSRVGLWKHKKTCEELSTDDMIEPTENTVEQVDTNKPSVDPAIVTILMEEVRKIITDQNKTFLEVVKVTGNNSHNTTTNNNNSHNKTFNLQIFLNETCKNAMNIMDFVDQIVLNLSDLEETGRIGFAEGISKMIMRRLQKLDVSERPIHCSDLKRETLYIKNQNKWEKEEDGKPVLTNAVKQIAGKNMMQIFDWQKAHPDYNDPETRTSDKYMKMLTNVMSGGTEEEINENYEKIIRNLIKEAAIDKEKFMI